MTYDLTGRLAKTTVTADGSTVVTEYTYNDAGIATQLVPITFEFTRHGGAGAFGGSVPAVRDCTSLFVKSLIGKAIDQFI